MKFLYLNLYNSLRERVLCSHRKRLTQIIYLLTNLLDNNTVKNNFKYIGNITYEFKIKSAKTEEILVDNINVNVNNYCSEINITEKFIKTLMQNCFSGIYRSIFDFEELYKAMNDIGFKINETYLPFYCDVCRKNLNNAQNFLSHIKNTKHKTDIEKDFPYCEEIIKVINNK